MESSPILVYLAIPSLHKGGTESQVRILYSTLTELGYDVRIITRKGLAGCSISDLKFMKIIEVPNKSGPNPLLLVKIYKLFHSESRKIFVFSYLDQMNVVFGILSFFTSFTWFSSERSDPRYRTSLYYSLSKLLMKRSRILCNSTVGLKYYRDRGYDVLKINNFIKNNYLLEDNYVWDKDFYTHSRLVSTKNILFLLHAWKIAKLNSRLFIFGSGPQFNDILLFIRMNSIQNVYLANELEEGRLLCEFSFFISASILEGFPNSPIEALLANKLLLLSNIDSHKDILEFNSEYLFDLNSVNTLVRLLRKSIDLSMDSYIKAIERQKEGLKRFSNESTALSYSEILK